MTPEERAAIYAAMTDDDDDIDGGETDIEQPLAPLSGSPLWTTIEIAGRPTVIPTVEYTRRLEMTVTAQARVIGQMQRQLARISSVLRAHRQAINRNDSRVQDFGRDLSNKIDRRDW